MLELDTAAVESDVGLEKAYFTHIYLEYGDKDTKIYSHDYHD